VKGQALFIMIPQCCRSESEVDRQKTEEGDNANRAFNVSKMFFENLFISISSNKQGGQDSHGCYYVLRRVVSDASVLLTAYYIH